MKTTEADVAEFFDELIRKTRKAFPYYLNPTVSASRAVYPGGRIGWCLFLHHKRDDCIIMESFSEMHTFLDEEIERRNHRGILFRKYS